MPPSRGVGRFVRPCDGSCWRGCRQCHQDRRIGSLFVQAPSSGRHAPCRGSGRRASPRDTSAAMAAANSVSRVSSARFWCGCVFGCGVFSPTPPLCVPSAIACGKRLPSRPSAAALPRVAVFGRGCRSAVVVPGCHCYRKQHPVPPPASLLSLSRLFNLRAEPSCYQRQAGYAEIGDCFGFACRGNRS